MLNIQVLHLLEIEVLPRWFLEKILYGTGDEKIDFEYSSAAGVRKFTAPFEGVLPTLDRRHSETKSQGMRSFYEMYMTNSHCLPIQSGHAP